MALASGEERPDYRAIAWLLVSAGGLSACLTLLFLGMRAVMDLGGACASGGPSVSAQPCPDGVPALMVIGMLGLFGFGGLGLWAGARVGGAWAALPLLAWPGLFLSLGWNFLEYGVQPPGEEPGPAVGWLFCGVVFILMGAVPLWIAISARNELREGGGSAVASRFGMAGSSRARSVAAGARPVATSESETESGAAESGPDLVSRLERLADLRRRGDLTDEEFEAAKARLLRGDR